MQVLVRNEYRADRKEKLGALVRRVAESFYTAGVEVRLHASFSDSPVADGVSAVARAVRKYPVVASLERSDPQLPGLSAVRRLSNLDDDAEFPLELALALSWGEWRRGTRSRGGSSGTRPTSGAPRSRLR